MSNRATHATILNTSTIVYVTRVISVYEGSKHSQFGQEWD